MKRLIAYLPHRAAPRLQGLLDLGLLGLIGWALLQAGQSFAAPELTNAPAQNIAARQSAAKNDISTIADLFFRPLDPAATRRAPQADSGNIRLFGTRPAGNGMGTAILSTGSAAQAIYQTGQSLGKNAVLTAVFADRVEISRNGEARSVFLLGRDKSQARRLIAQSSATGQNDNFAAPRKEKLDTRFFDLLDLKLASNGLLIRDNAARDVLEKFSLKPGDIITEADGIALTGLSALQLMAQRLQSGATLTVNVLRNGESFSTSINTGAVDLAQMDD